MKRAKAGTLRTGIWARRRPLLYRSQLFLVSLAVACGVGGAFAAIVFRVLIRFFTALFFAGGEGVSAFFQTSWLAEAGDPLGLASALPGGQSSPSRAGRSRGRPGGDVFPARGQGPRRAEVMEAVALRGGMIRGRTVALRPIASASPSAPADRVGARGRSSRSAPHSDRRSGSSCVSRRAFCARSSAAARPPGSPRHSTRRSRGPLFAVEIIIGDFAVAQLSPIVISSVVATVLSRWLLGDHPSLPGSRL